jgi:hypothetical protein
LAIKILTIACLSVCPLEFGENECARKQLPFDSGRDKLAVRGVFDNIWCDALSDQASEG